MECTWFTQTTEDPFKCCNMTTEGGGWTVFQRRMDGSVDFYLGWEDYRVGFGNLSGEFWLGNDNLQRLTANAAMMLRVDLEDYDGVRKYAEYTTFSVADADDNYIMAPRVTRWSCVIGQLSKYAGKRIQVKSFNSH